jgi:hypothetical protein
MVCYCFGYRVEEIERDVLEHHGHSSILDQILAERQAGNCQCASRHPEGR